MKRITKLATYDMVALAMGEQVRKNFKSQGKIPKYFTGIGDGMASRPVFLLTFHDGEKLVVKAEGNRQGFNNGAIESLGAGGDIMGTISADAKSEPLDAGERLELLNIAQEKRSLDHYYLLDLILAMMGPTPVFIWHKMEFIDRLKDLEKAVENNKGGKIIGKLMQDGAMETLGKILAADMFLGNEDRFNRAGKIVNPGNIIFRKTANKLYVPIGLDFYEAMGECSNISKPLVQHQAWTGDVLKDKSTINIFGAACIRSLNEYCGTVENNIEPLRSPHTRRLIDGIVAGKDEILRHLAPQYGQLSQGVKDRMQELGWRPWGAAAANSNRGAFRMGGRRGVNK